MARGRLPFRHARLPAVLAAGFLLAVPAACRKPGDPVREALEAAASAAGKRDAAALLQRISPAYRDAEGSGPAEIGLTVRRFLSAYDSLSVGLSDVKADRKEREAWASFRADLSGTPTKLGGLDAWLPRSSAWRFEVRLVEERGEWLVAWASWTRLD